MSRRRERRRNGLRSTEDGFPRDTFVDSSVQGGMGRAIAQVGACKRSECVHDTDLECHAPAITVGSAQDLTDCLTFESR